MCPSVEFGSDLTRKLNFTTSLTIIIAVYVWNLGKARADDGQTPKKLFKKCTKEVGPTYNH